MKVFVHDKESGKLLRVHQNVRRIVRCGEMVEFWGGYRLYLGSCPIDYPWQAIVPYCGDCKFEDTPLEGTCYCCQYAKKVDGSDS